MLKYQIHDKEVDSQDEADVAMGSVRSIWMYSFSQDMTRSISAKTYLEEMGNIYSFCDDRTGNSLDDASIIEARNEELFKNKVKKQKAKLVIDHYDKQFFKKNFGKGKFGQ